MYNKINFLSNLALLFVWSTIFLLFSPKSFADSLSVFPPPETNMKTGSEFTLPISVTGARDLGALQFDVLFNEEIIEIVNVTQGSGLPPVLLDFNVVHPGLLRVAMAGSEPVDGNAKIELRIRGLAAGTGSIDVKEVKAWELTTGFELLAESTPGTVSVTSGFSFSGIIIAAVILLLLIALFTIIVRMRRKKIRVQDLSEIYSKPYEKAQETPSFKRFCPSCGQKLSSNAAFCEHCGEKI